jgi:hypothetical protein
MIELYNRDAAFAAELLGRVAGIHEALFDADSPTRGHELMSELEAWAPNDTPARASSDRKHQLVAERLRAIIAAIEGQATTG